jgi:hypothetical protein
VTVAMLAVRAARTLGVVSVATPVMVPEGLVVKSPATSSAIVANVGTAALGTRV